MSTTLLIDADGLVYWAGFGREEHYDWGAGVTSTHADVLQGQDTIRDTIEAWGETLLADDVVICLSDETRRYFRHDVLPSYKHNRKSTKPELYDALRSFMKGNWRTYQRDGLEADDVCGILATSPVIIPGRKVVVSVDKDFLSVPCNLFNPNRPNEGIITIGNLAADTAHMMQALMGDTVDGYKGCWKVGEKGAREIVGRSAWTGDNASHDLPMDCLRRRMWDAVVGAFRTANRKYNIDRDPEQDALTQARVARILRRDDYDFTMKEVKLWNPPSLIHNPEDFPLWKFKSEVHITNA
jgi:DNA polymerase-1